MERDNDSIYRNMHLEGGRQGMNYGGGGLTPLIKTWTPPKEVKQQVGGGRYTPWKKVDPPDCHCIICTLEAGLEDCHPKLMEKVWNILERALFSKVHQLYTLCILSPFTQLTSMLHKNLNISNHENTYFLKYVRHCTYICITLGHILNCNSMVPSMNTILMTS